MHEILQKNKLEIFDTAQQNVILRHFNFNYPSYANGSRKLTLKSNMDDWVLCSRRSYQHLIIAIMI